MQLKRIILSTIMLIFLAGTMMLTAQAGEKIEIKAQTGHAFFADSVAFSLDGRYALSGSSDDSLILWEAATGREIRKFIGHSGAVSSVVFSSDGKYVLSGSQDDSLRLWEAATGREIWKGEWKTYHAVNSAALSPDGRYALYGGWKNGANLCLLDTATGKEIRSFTGHSDEVTSVRFSPYGRYALSGSTDKTLRLWEVATGKEIRKFTGHSKEINSVAFSPDGMYVLSGSTDKTLRLWEVATGKKIRKFTGHSKNVSSVAFSPDGMYVLSGSMDKTLRLWEAATGRMIWKITSHRDIYSAVFSPDGKYILSGGWPGGPILLETATGKEIRAFTGHSTNVNSVAFSPDGRYALAGGWIKALTLWETATGREIWEYNTYSYEVNSVAFSPDGRYALAGNWDKTLRLWETATGKEIRCFTGHSDEVTSVTFSRDGIYALSGSIDKTLRLWEAATGKEIRKFKGHSDKVTSVAFSPDGRYALSGSMDYTLILWDVATGKEIRKFKGHTGYVYSMALSPDGKYALSGGSDNTIILWNAATGGEIRKFTEDSSSAFSIAFSPDSLYALTGGLDNTLTLWDVATGKELRRFTGHYSTVNSAAFSPDGKYALSGSLDTTTRLWDIATGKELVQYIFFDDGEWLCITPDGYFNASADGAKNINVVQGMNVFSIDNFFDTYYRPDIITARIKGQDTTAIAQSDITKGIKLPPEISISLKTKSGSYGESSAAAAGDYLIEQGMLKVQITAKDSGGGMKGVRLFNNGKAAGENIRGLKVEARETQNSFEFDVALADGLNTLKAIGFSSDMTESNPVTAEVFYTAAKAGKPDMYMLAVGINEYRNTKYNLNYCVADVTGFIEILTPRAKRIFDNVEAVTLLNTEATRENILKAFESIKSRIKPEDVFTFFYSGHGIALEVMSDDQEIKLEFFYVLHDVVQMTDGVKCATDGFSGTEMKKQLAEIKAAKQILFVDACNSGAFAGQFAARGAAEENALAKLSRATGSVILASTTTEQSALEFSVLKHGAFTFVVIEALEGNAALANGQLTAASIKAFVDDRIPEITEKYRGTAQYPVTFLWGNDFPIGLK